MLEVQYSILSRYTKENKNFTSSPFLLTFKEKEEPRFIEIPGEQAETKANDYYDRPMSCMTCLKNGHTVNGCRETIATCPRCSNQGHNKDKCISTEIKCYRCKADLQGFSKNCQKIKR